MAGEQAFAHSCVSEPAANLGFVTEIGLAEFFRQIGFFGRDDAELEHEKHDDQRQKKPEAVGSDSEAHKAQQYRHINRIAGGRNGSG